MIQRKQWEIFDGKRQAPHQVELVTDDMGGTAVDLGVKHQHLLGLDHHLNDWFSSY